MATKREKVERVALEGVGIKTLLLDMVGGEQVKVDVPANALLTFGPGVPGRGTTRDFSDPSREYALRVYGKTKSDLIACFSGVKQFRPLEMPVAKAVIREAGKTVWKSDETGYSVSTEVKRSKALLPDIATSLNSNDDPPF